MAFKTDLLDQLLEGCDRPEDILGPDGLFAQLKKALAERALAAELAHHLAEEAQAAAPEPSGNHRNGSSAKTVQTETGALTLAIPRDRAGTFTPQLVPKHRRRLPHFDEQVLSLYAHGLSVREMQEHLHELYGTEVSPTLISAITDAVQDEVREWQQRQLLPLYPVIFFDALRVKIRDEGVVRNQAVYLALSIAPDGTRDILGLWIEQTEGAKFWLRVLTELKSRGVQDVLFAVVDGLKGFPEAIAVVYPQAAVQTCIVHLLRNSLSFVNWKERKAVAAQLRAIYQAPTAEAAAQILEAFTASAWGTKYPAIGPLWRRQWEQVIPFFAYPPEIRRVLYTTNAIESLHMRLRKIIKSRGHFPSPEAATKLLYLALRNIVKRWTMVRMEWRTAMSHFALQYPDRFTLSR